MSLFDGRKNACELWSLCETLSYISSASADNVLPIFPGVVEGTCSTVTTVAPTLQELLKNSICFSGTGDSCAHLMSQVDDFSSSKQGNLMNFFFSPLPVNGEVYTGVSKLC